MTKFQNMKIEINEQQPLDEVVRELERLGYTKLFGGVVKNTIEILTYENKGWFNCFSESIKDDDYVLTTLAQLKAIEK